MEQFTVYGRPGCGFCQQAKLLLEHKQLAFHYIDIQAEGLTQRDLNNTVGRTVRTLPQIFHGNSYIGGFKELQVYISEEVA